MYEENMTEMNEETLITPQDAIMMAVAQMGEKLLRAKVKCISYELKEEDDEFVSIKEKIDYCSEEIEQTKAFIADHLAMMLDPMMGGQMEEGDDVDYEAEELED